jgi:integrase
MKETIKSTHGVIRFSLKESIRSLELNPKKESLIMFHFSTKGKRFKKSIGYKCPLKQWDILKQQVKTGKSMMLNAYKVNAFINDIRAFTENELSEMIKKNRYIDIDKLSSLVGKRINGIEEVEIDNSNIIKYSNKLIEEKKISVKISTYNTYVQTIRLLKLYEKNFSVLKFESIDMTFYRNFKSLLEKEGYSLNSIGKHIKNLKTFLNAATEQGLNTNLAYNSKPFVKPTEKSEQIYLNEEELERIIKLDFSESKELEQARDLFIIGAYTGLRVSDFNGLTKDNIYIHGNKRIFRLYQKKTGEYLPIPIHPMVETILKKRNGNPPNKMPSQRINVLLEVIGEKAGINEVVTIKKTKGGKKETKLISKYLMIKNHTARRSFCTNAYLAKMSTLDIMAISGHKSEKTFLNYIKVSKDERAIKIADSYFFKPK